MTLVLDSVRARLGGRVVLDGAGLCLSAGEVVGVIGPNGAGKSTLLKVAAGLITPDGGSVVLDGRPLSQWQRSALGRRIAYLPQQRIVGWPMAVRAVVALGRLPYRGFGSVVTAADEAAVTAALAAADVAQLADRPVTALSGGEQARVLLARALAQDAPILVADEPVAGLDPAHQLDLFNRFRAMAADGRSVLVALHDLGAAARFCDRLLLLDHGQQAALGPPRDVMTEARLASVYGIRARVSDIDGVPIVLPLDRLT